MAGREEAKRKIWRKRTRPSHEYITGTTRKIIWENIKQIRPNCEDFPRTTWQSGKTAGNAFVNFERTKSMVKKHMDEVYHRRQFKSLYQKKKTVSFHRNSNPKSCLAPFSVSKSNGLISRCSSIFLQLKQESRNSENITHDQIYILI